MSGKKDLLKEIIAIFIGVSLAFGFAFMISREWLKESGYIK